MSKLAKSNEPPKPGGEEVAFEAAMQRLETIVDAMEAGDLPLEGLLAKFEEGTRLVQVCQRKLADAEVKVQQLEKHLAGEFKLKSAGLAENDET